MSIFTKTSTYDPMSAYTPEQRQAIQGLSSLASTGSGLGINLGEGYGGSLGNYNVTGVEQAGLGSLMQLLTGQSPYINQAANVYSNAANTQFNPDDPSSGFAAFQRQVARAAGDANNSLNREAAMTGNRFGTAIAGQKQELAAKQSDSLQSELARLWENAQNRQLQGAQGLQGLGNLQAQLSQQAITQGGLERDLLNQQAQMQYGEWQRSRGEKLNQIGLAQDQWQNPMGKITQKAPSMLGKMLGTISPIMGEYNNQRFGYSTGQMNMADMAKAAVGVASGGMGGFLGTALGGGLGNTLSGALGKIGQGNVAGTGIFGTKLGGKTQSEILGFDTAQYRTSGR